MLEAYLKSLPIFLVISELFGIFNVISLLMISI